MHVQQKLTLHCEPSLQSAPCRSLTVNPRISQELTSHVWATAILLNILLALRASFRHLVNRCQSPVLLVDAVLDAELILCARFTFMPGTIARHTGFGAALRACAEVPSDCRHRVRFRKGEEALPLERAIEFRLTWTV